MKLRTAFLATSVAAIAFPAFAQDKVQVQWWHAMGGELGQLLEQVAAGFNATQDRYEVVPSFRGTYAETMTGAIAAFRAGEQPHIVQVFEVGTGTMMAADGAIYPIYQLMADAGRSFDPRAYLPTIVGYYTDPSGNMLSFPFNSSTPIMYYNKDVFAAAGLDADNPPKTWAEMEAAAQKIVESGAAKCGFTTSWPAWLMLENFTAWHDIPMATKENGFAGFDTEFVFNVDLVSDHWDNLKRWQDAGAFRWGGPGPGPDAAPLFYAGECAMFFGSSASRAGVLNNAKFDVGFGMQPYYDTHEGAPQNTIIGGATLWVLQGHDKPEYEAVAAFFEYLSSAEVQAKWHQDTGYLPITQASYDLTRTQGYYDANPGSETALKQMTLNAPTENSKGIRFGNYVQIRDVVSEEMEAVMTGAKTGKQATDDAVSRGNALLREFEASIN